MRNIFVVIILLFMAGNANAQISINLGFNFESQPIWGPTGYDHVDYYYLPDIEVYYNVPQRRFFYYERGIWVSGSSLPYRYRNYDFYNSYKVVVNERSPYRNHIVYRDRYSSYRGRHDQQSIRDSRDSRYYMNKNHPEHNNWKKQQQQDKGKDNDQGNKRRRK